eukprot:TRINITY_DN1724_c0_g1_i13.p3 TRINITY_DN1724_c0_g1~~TRINITY_DN1724_c0_g1_i13.p3  ORF type:complete len:104 (+),score=28.87 TRINITY_DN1724_c0_g1_i13:81-392(+)
MCIRDSQYTQLQKSKEQGEEGQASSQQRVGHHEEDDEEDKHEVKNTYNEVFNGGNTPNNQAGEFQFSPEGEHKKSSDSGKEESKESGAKSKGGNDWVIEDVSL